MHVLSGISLLTKLRAIELCLLPICSCQSSTYRTSDMLMLMLDDQSVTLSLL